MNRFIQGIMLTVLICQWLVGKAAAEPLYVPAIGGNGALSLAYSPDGTTLAAGAQDTVVLFTEASGKLQRRLPVVGQRGIRCVAFRKNGKVLASGSDDKTIKLWEVETGKLIATLAGHTGAVSSLTFISEDGKTLASGSTDKTIKLWDLSKAKELATLKGNTSEACAIAFSRDGKTLTSVHADSTIKLWTFQTLGADIDYAAGAEQQAIKGNKGAMHVVALSADSRTVASVNADSTIKVWDAATGKEHETFKGHKGGINCLAFSPDAKTLASYGKTDRAISLWTLNIPESSAEESRLKNAKPKEPKDPKLGKATPDGHERKIAAFKLPAIGGAVITPDTKKLIVSLPSERKLAFFDLMNDEEIKRLALDFEPSVMARQGNKLIVGGEEKTRRKDMPLTVETGGKKQLVGAKETTVLHILDLETLEELKSIKLPGDLGIQALACHPEKGLVYALNWNWEILAVDIVAGTARATKAKGQLIAVDPVEGKFVYAGVVCAIEGELNIPDGARIDSGMVERKKGKSNLNLLKVSDRAVMVKYTVSGNDLVVSGFNDNAAFTGLQPNHAYEQGFIRGFGLSPDGKQITLVSAVGWGARSEPAVKRNETVAVFETSDMKTFAGSVETRRYPGAIAFHPVLNLGTIYREGIGAESELVIFNRSAKAFATTEKLTLAPGTYAPLFLNFGAQGTKAVIYPLGRPLGLNFERPAEVVLQFVPLTLNDEDKLALQKAYAGTTELKLKK